MDDHGYVYNTPTECAEHLGSHLYRYQTQE